MVLKSKNGPTEGVLRLLPLFLQLTRFGMVGISAAFVHFSVVVFLVEWGWLQPLLANILAFSLAFQVSYWGHRRFTFKHTSQEHRIAFPRLLLVSVSAFLVNETLFYFLMKKFNLSYEVALLLVLMVLPLGVFLVNKFWVFGLQKRVEV